jgi:hypothetical protein
VSGADSVTVDARRSAADGGGNFDPAHGASAVSACAVKVSLMRPRFEWYARPTLPLPMPPPPLVVDPSVEHDHPAEAVRHRFFFAKARSVDALCIAAWRAYRVLP